MVTLILINVVIMMFWVVLLYLLRENAGKIGYGIVFTGTMLFLVYNSWFTYSVGGENYSDNYGKLGTALTSLTKNAPGYAVSKTKDKTLFRFDTAGISTGDVKRNSSMILHQYSTAYYYSTNGSDYPEFIHDLEFNYGMEQTYNNLDKRAYADALLGVKYMISSAEDKADYKKDLVPYFVGALLLFSICTFVKILQTIGNKINEI